MGTGPGLSLQESADLVFVQVWNRSEPVSQSQPIPRMGFPNPLLTLLIRFAIFYYGMYNISKSLYIYTYGQSTARWYLSLITRAPGDAEWEYIEIHLEAGIICTGGRTWRPTSNEF
jgi:hypothetical protein